MARRVSLPVPLMIVAKTEARVGLVLLSSLEEREDMERERRCRRWLPVEALGGIVGAIGWSPSPERLQN